jgi:uncharacterized protein
MRAINSTKHSELAGKLRVADTLFARMKGLLGKSVLAEGEGLWIRPCKGIHTFGMKFPIDAVFLNGANHVVAVKKELFPNRMTQVFFAAVSVLELPPGTIDATATIVGDEITFV